MGVAGLGEQSFGFDDVAGGTFVERCIIADIVGGQDLGRGAGQAAHDVAHNGVAVHGEVDRLAHTKVLERVAPAGLAIFQRVVLHVEAEEHRAEFVNLGDREVGAGSQAGDVLAGNVDHEIELSGQQGGDAGGVVADGDIVDLVDITFEFAPIGGVAGEHGSGVGCAAGQHVGAGAVGVAGGKTFGLYLEVLRRERVVGLRPGAAHDGDVDKLVRHQRIGTRRGDVDGGLKPPMNEANCEVGSCARLRVKATSAAVKGVPS